MNYSIINTCDTANGDGVRVSLFVSGCGHHCPGCFSPQTWDPHYGQPFGEEDLQYILQSLEPNYIDGLSILGGDPLYPNNRRIVADICVEVKKKFPNKTIYLWTGYTVEELRQDAQLNSVVMPKHSSKYPIIIWRTKGLLETIEDNIDVIVDGRFEEDKKDLTLHMRGSSNQRIWVKKDGVWIQEE